MTLLETVRFALRGITANKLRSGLTVLGILIGVAAVILLVAVGNGSAKQIQDSIEQLFDRIAKELAAGYQRIKIKVRPGWDVAIAAAVVIGRRAHGHRARASNVDCCIPMAGRAAITPDCSSDCGGGARGGGVRLVPLRPISLRRSPVRP